jgi:hypothetical protein
LRITGRRQLLPRLPPKFRPVGPSWPSPVTGINQAGICTIAAHPRSITALASTVSKARTSPTFFPEKLVQGSSSRAFRMVILALVGIPIMPLALHNLAPNKIRSPFFS